MRRTIELWEVYVTRFEDALERHRQGRLSADEAGEALGMSGRQFRRLRKRFAAEGAEGLRDHRLGRVSNRRAPEAELDRMHRLYREEYPGDRFFEYVPALQEAEIRLPAQ